MTAKTLWIAGSHCGLLRTVRRCERLTGFLANDWSRVNLSRTKGSRGMLPASLARAGEAPTEITDRRRYRGAARAYALSISTRKMAAIISMDDRCFVQSW